MEFAFAWETEFFGHVVQDCAPITSLYVPAWCVTVTAKLHQKIGKGKTSYERRVDEQPFDALTSHAIH